MLGSRPLKWAARTTFNPIDYGANEIAINLCTSTAEQKAKYSQLIAWLALNTNPGELQLITEPEAATHWQRMLR
jgi:hypothetical protein